MRSKLKTLIKNAVLLFWSIAHRDDSPKVVYYHDIGVEHTKMGTPLDLFIAHMKFVRNGDTVCFDDGFHGIWDHRDVLRQLHVRPKVFLAIRLVGQDGYLTWDEIKALQQEFGVDFQCHTWSHQSLSGPLIEESPARTESESWYEHELEDSRCEMERHLGSPVNELCFPAGYYNEKVVSWCRKTGYACVYCSDPVGSDDGYVKARCIAQDASIWAFRAILNGGLGAFAQRYKRRHFV